MWFLSSLCLLAMTASAQKPSRWLQQKQPLCESVSSSCIDRSKRIVHAFYLGNENDPFWQRIVFAANRAGKDHGVTFLSKLYSEVDATSMALDIRQTVQQGVVDAMIVSISSVEVHEASEEAIAAGIAVFGVNNTYHELTSKYFAAIVSRDEYEAGKSAANRFLQEWKEEGTINKAIFVNHEPENVALSQRFTGFRHGILSVFPNASVHQVKVDVSTPFANFNVERVLRPLMEDCNADFVMSGGSLAAMHTLDVVKKWNSVCSSRSNSSSSPGRTLFGTFDSSFDLISEIASGNALFVVDQQPVMQATLPVALASLYVTTGKVPSDPTMSIDIAPILLDSNNLPALKYQACADLLGKMDCFDRSKIRMRVIFDDDTANAEGADAHIAATEQAAKDLGIHLDYEIAKGDTMVDEIDSLCRNHEVDALFVSVPSVEVADALEYCQSQSVQVVILPTTDRIGITSFTTVGRLHVDFVDLARNYYQGYLSIALLTYLTETRGRLSKEPRFEPSQVTSSIYKLQQSCGPNPFLVCEKGSNEGTIEDMNVPLLPGTSEIRSTLAPSSEHIPTFAPDRESPKIRHFVLTIIIIVCALVGFGVVLHVLSLILNRVRRCWLKMYDTGEDDDATVSIDEDEQDLETALGKDDEKHVRTTTEETPI